MQINVSQQNWASGELSGRMEGRSELPAYKAGAKRLFNFISEVSGGARYRPGSQFVNPTRRNQVACLIPFQFNDSQAYELEFTAGFIRFYRNNQILTLTALDITAATQANPVVVTSEGHGLSNDDEVIITEVAGMTQLNNRNFVVKNKTDDTFELYDVNGTAGIDGTDFDAYVSGGKAAQIYEVANPYAVGDLFEIKYAQNADVMYLVHPSYAPYKLTRAGATNWTMGTFTRTADPFTGSGKYPACVAFYNGRLYYGRTNDNPQTIWASLPLDDNGDPQYDDMTIGADPTDGFKITLSSITGKVDVIEDIIPCINFLGICTYQGISKMTDGQGGTAMYAGAIDIQPAVTQGVLQQIRPILLGTSMIFVHRTGLILYSLEFDIFYNAYNALDKNLTNEHLNVSGLKQMHFCYGRPCMLVAVRNDGQMVWTTFQVKENINGGHKHGIGGLDGKVLSIGVMPRTLAYDQIWMVTERTVDGQTVRSVEYINDEVTYPLREDFFSGEENKVVDDAKWRNTVFELQKQEIHTDATLSYFGDDYATVSIAIGAKSGSNVIFTASGSVFDSTMVGRQIWKKSVNGVGTGRAEITAYISATQVVCNILTAFDSMTDLPIDGWYLTTDTVSGAWHLENELVNVVADGAQDKDKVVNDGKITIQNQASVIHIGKNYLGMLMTMPVEQDSNGQSSEGMGKMINRVAVHFFNTLAVKCGSNLYNLEEVEFRRNTDLTGRPSPPVSDLLKFSFEDEKEIHKHIYIVQDRPLPCCVLGIAPYMDVDTES